MLLNDDEDTLFDMMKEDEKSEQKTQKQHHTNGTEDNVIEFYDNVLIYKEIICAEPITFQSIVKLIFLRGLRRSKKASGNIKIK